MLHIYHSDENKKLALTRQIGKKSNSLKAAETVSETLNKALKKETRSQIRYATTVLKQVAPTTDETRQVLVGIN